MWRAEAVSSIKSVLTQWLNESQWGIITNLIVFIVVATVLFCLLVSLSSWASSLYYWCQHPPRFLTVSHTLLALYSFHCGFSLLFSLMLSAHILVLRWGNHVRIIVLSTQMRELIKEANWLRVTIWNRSRVQHCLFFCHNLLRPLHSG